MILVVKELKKKKTKPTRIKTKTKITIIRLLNRNLMIQKIKGRDKNLNLMINLKIQTKKMTKRVKMLQLRKRRLTSNIISAF
jgi:hypothetical protein